jgi:hypothetical protein
MAGFQKWPLGLLGMISLVWGAESCLWVHHLNWLDITSLTWALSGRAADRGEVVWSDVLCFGDSLLKFGLLLGVIERRTGRRAYNLGVNAGRAPGSYFLLRRALRAGARPRAVLIDYEPNMLATPPLSPPGLWAELAGADDCVELAWAARDPGLLARLLLARCSLAVRYRGEIRAAVLARLRGHDPRTGDEVPPLLRNVARNRGAMVMTHRDRAPVRVDPMNLGFFPDHWSCHWLNRRYVRKFLDLASDHDVPVFWVITPYTPAIQDGRERRGQDAAFTRFVEAMRSRSAGVTVLDARRSRYPEPVFWDGAVHLDGRGARNLSEDVAAVLAASLSGKAMPGWVTLPGYAGRPADDALEDLDQSRTALRASGGRRF